MTDLLPDMARPEPADPPGTPTAGPEYSRLVKPDRVHGSLYTDPRIFADELARIWYRTWVYVGHVSEIRQPGDYVRKSIGLQDVIMTRAADGGVHLLLNRCAHRANLVCEADRGNSKSFRCPYHGWTYRNTGELIGFPFNQGYGGKGTIEGELSLASVPRIDSHQGFVFASMAADGPGSRPPSLMMRPSGSVTSSVPRRSREPKPSASRTTRGRSESTVSTLSGVTEINADMDGPIQ